MTLAIGNFVLAPAGCSPQPSGNTSATGGNGGNLPPGSGTYTTKLSIPPLAKNTSTDPSKVTYELTVQKGTSPFLQGKSTPTLGYNGNYLGPVLRAKKGQQVSVKIKNNLDEETTVHWHGVILPGEMDGGPHQIIAPGAEWNPNYTIQQPAATVWYHAHPMGKTGEQVYKGLAGVFIIDDDESQSLSIPKDYGVNDIPLVIQDRRFAADGTLRYMDDPNDMLLGLMGDTILVNGVVTPTLDVSTVKMRFRLLNGSNARQYKLSLSNGAKFSQIASDAGFLEAPVELDTLPFAPGERAEIIVDFSANAVGDVITLKNENMKIMDFNVKQKGNDTTSVPAKLTTIAKIDEKTAVKTRNFRFTGGGDRAGINGLQMTVKTGMDTIHETVNAGDTEIWEWVDQTGLPHPLHIHGVHFQVLDRDGQPPPVNEQGWKDVLLIDNSRKARVIMKFTQKGIFMFHCHNLEHEDGGMMLQYESK